MWRREKKRKIDQTEIHSLYSFETKKKKENEKFYEKKRKEKGFILLLLTFH